MSLQVESTVDRRGIPLPVEALTAHWPLGGWYDVVPVPGGKNEHFRVASVQGEFFLRRSHRGKPVAELIGQLELMSLLKSRGLPVPLVVPTVAGAGHAVIDQRLWVLTEALGGTPYDPDRPAHLEGLARMLARYHHTVADLEAGVGEPAPLAELRLRAARVPLDPFLRERASRVLAELGRLAPELPRLVIHGGARRGSVLFHGDRLTGLLDLDSAGPDVRVLDLAVAAHDVAKVYTVPGAEDHKVRLDLDRIAAFLAAYTDRAGELSPAEARALPLLIEVKRLKRAFGRLSRLDGGEPLSANDHAKIGLEGSRVRWLHAHREELAEICAAASRPGSLVQGGLERSGLADLVVVGVGHVGLPLASCASRAGLTVVGLDLDRTVVESLTQGRSHVDDVPDVDVAALLRRGFEATTDATVLRRAATVAVCVPTPLGTDGVPDLRAVTAASATIGRYLRPGTLVVLVSTGYPGTTDEVVRPILEDVSGLTVGSDFHLAFSPDRMDPGNRDFGLTNTPRIVGGETAMCAEAARRFYGRFVETVVMARGTREAEAAKLLENAYRQVNIALVNELAQCFHDLDVDVWDVLRLAATKPFGFQSFRPGPGVGGSCIPVDPGHLAHRARARLGYPLRIVEVAQEVNEAMPAYVVRRARDLLNDGGKAVRNSTILLLGVTYKANVADLRESPATKVAARLVRMGARVRYHDPHVTEWSVAGVSRAPDDLVTAAVAADLVVLLQDHDLYDLEALATTGTRVLDTRGAVPGPNVQRL